MTPDRLPWEIIETLPHSDTELLAAWHDRVAEAIEPDDLVPALVGRALAAYWAPALELIEEPAMVTVKRRDDDLAEAEALARNRASDDLIAVALVGRLYAGWGPPDPEARREVLRELEVLRPSLTDAELRVRIVEWQVLQCFDLGDLDGVRQWIDEFLREARSVDSKLFTRREVLWRANLEMLEGRIEASVRTNEEAIASTADLAGSPFSFQNVAITMAIAKYLERGLGDLIDAIHSIRASSPRVAANWDVGLAFALSESGGIDDGRVIFDQLAGDGFAAVPRDLNWLVTTTLLGLIAVNLHDEPRAEELLIALRPYAALDATHGSGYASYGPVGRVVGLLAAAVGRASEAEEAFGAVLSSRDPGPWTTLTRADRARNRRETDPRGALADAERAHRELQDLGLTARADEMRALTTAILQEGHANPLARLNDGTWSLTHPTGGAEVKDGVGIQALCRLLARPGEPISTLDLDPRVDRSLPRSATTETRIDTTAREAYRRRLRQLEASGDPTPETQAEVAFLRKELAGGGHAAATSKEIEKARVRVTKSVRRAIDSIADRSPGLGDHLRASVQTGLRCSYQPADGTRWRIEQ